MGREIRRVPPNWEHPTEEHWDPRLGKTVTKYKPLLEKTCEQAWAEWQKDYAEWLAGEYERILAKYGNLPEDQPYVAFVEWHGMPPNPDNHRPPFREGEATWWQVYETVSEGTPVSPAFETPEELIDYLVANGDFWDQKRRTEGNSSMPCEPWTREQAEKFVKGSGWAPSFVMDSKGFRSGVEALTDMHD